MNKVEIAEYEARAREAKAKQNRETAQWILDVATWWRKYWGNIVAGSFFVWLIFFNYPSKAPDFHVVANEQQHIWRVYNNDWLIEAFPSLQEAEEARDKYEQEAEEDARQDYSDN